MSLSCLRLKKRSSDDAALTTMLASFGIKKKRTDSMTPVSNPELGTSMVPSTSGIRTNPSDDIIFVQKLIVQLADELYDLARKNWFRKAIGGTIIVYHLREDTADWCGTVQTFISLKPYEKPYKPGIFKKIFTSKGPEHDGAIIFYLANGLVDSVSTKLPMAKHNCSQCLGRGTRHASACSFSNFTAVPIIVMSEERGQVSLFWKGRAKHKIKKDDLIQELWNAYKKQEDAVQAYTKFDDQYFSKFFHLNPVIPNDDRYEWFNDCFKTNVWDYLENITFTVGEEENPRTIAPENPEHELAMNHYIDHLNTNDMLSYEDGHYQCIILSHGDKRLGGFFYFVSGTVITMCNIFLLRQLLHNGFAARFFKEVFWKKMFPQCTRIHFMVPDQLKGAYDYLIEALNDKKEWCIKHWVTPGDTIECSPYEDLPDDCDSQSEWLADDGDDDSDCNDYDDGNDYKIKINAFHLIQLVLIGE